MPRQKGCDVVLHGAAWAKDWGPYAEAYEANVTGTERVLVQRPLAEKLCKALAEVVAALPFGNPDDPKVFAGPLATAAALEKVERAIAAAKAAGAQALVPGAKLPGGYYRSASLHRLPDGTHHVPGYTDVEVFGPDLCVEVIDSESGCGGTAMLVLAACAAARAGAEREAVVARVREGRKSLKIWFCLDTLEYLRRGGRIGKAQAWLGGTLKIKPILSLEYEIMPVERVRTAGRAFERMVNYAQELHASGSDGWVVQHIQAHEQAERLTERCRELFGSEPLFTSEVGPVIGTYTGPGLIGVGGIPRALLT